MSVTSIRSGPDVVAMERALKSFTELRHLDLTYDLSSKSYVLRLTLARPGSEETKTLVCRNVQNLELNPEGGNFSQFLSLHLEDNRADGLGQIYFTVDELEQGTLFFHCSHLELT